MNENLINYFLTCATIFASFAAIIISIGTAKRQNKIALFEKRYEAYYIVSCLLGSTLDYKKSIDIVQKIIKKLILLLNNQTIDESTKENLVFEETVAMLIFNYATYFKKIELLFGKKIKKDYSIINDFVDKYIDILIQCSQNVLDEDSLLDELDVRVMIPKLEEFCETLSKHIKL